MRTLTKDSLRWLSTSILLTVGMLVFGTGCAESVSVNPDNSDVQTSEADSQRRVLDSKQRQDFKQKLTKFQSNHADVGKADMAGVSGVCDSLKGIAGDVGLSTPKIGLQFGVDAGVQSTVLNMKGGVELIVDLYHNEIAAAKFGTAGFAPQISFINAEAGVHAGAFAGIEDGVEDYYGTHASGEITVPTSIPFINAGGGLWINSENRSYTSRSEIPAPDYQDGRPFGGYVKTKATAGWFLSAFSKYHPWEKVSNGLTQPIAGGGEWAAWKKGTMLIHDLLKQVDKTGTDIDPRLVTSEGEPCPDNWAQKESDRWHPEQVCVVKLGNEEDSHGDRGYKTANALAKITEGSSIPFATSTLGTAAIGLGYMRALGVDTVQSICGGS